MMNPLIGLGVFTFGLSSIGYHYALFCMAREKKDNGYLIMSTVALAVSAVSFTMGL